MAVRFGLVAAFLLFCVLTCVSLGVSLGVTYGVISFRRAQEREDAREAARHMVRYMGDLFTGVAQAATYLEGYIHALPFQGNASHFHANGTLRSEEERLAAVADHAGLRSIMATIGPRVVARHRDILRVAALPAGLRRAPFMSPPRDRVGVTDMLLSLRSAMDTRRPEVRATDPTVHTWTVVYFTAALFTQAVRTIPQADLTATVAGRSALFGYLWGYVEVSVNYTAALETLHVNHHLESSEGDAAHHHDGPHVVHFTEARPTDYVVQVRDVGTLTRHSHRLDHLPAAARNATLAEITADGERQVSDDGFTAYALPVGGFSSVSQRAVLACVVGSLCFSLVTVFAVTVAVAVVDRYQSLQEEATAKAVPRTAPFAIVTTEICGAGPVWATAAPVMGDVLPAVNEAVRRLATQHRAFEGQEVADGNLFSVAQPAAAVAFAQAIQGWADRAQWSSSTARHFPGNRVRLRVVVHWARAVRAPMRGRNRVTVEYTGNDVRFVCALRRVAPAGAVTCTPALCEAIGAPVAAFHAELEEFRAEQLRLRQSTSTGADGVARSGRLPPSRIRGGAVMPQLVLHDIGTCDAHGPCNGAGCFVAAADPPTLSPEDRAQWVTAGDLLRDERRRNAPVREGRNVLEELADAQAFIDNKEASWLPSRACSWPEAKPMMDVADGYASQVPPHDQMIALTIATYFYRAYSIALSPLEGSEQRSIFRRLQTVFGIPERRFLTHLAMRCGAICWQQLYGERRAGALQTSLPRRASLHVSRRDSAVSPEARAGAGVAGAAAVSPADAGLRRRPTRPASVGRAASTCDDYCSLHMMQPATPERGLSLGLSTGAAPSDRGMSLQPHAQLMAAAEEAAARGVSPVPVVPSK